MYGLKAGWLVGFMVFLCIVCTILFNVYFGKFVMTFIDIGNIGCMSISKCHWMVIVVNLVKQTWLFCMIQPVGVVLCMPGQYRVCPPLAGIIATRRRDYKALRAFYRDFCPFIQHWQAELTKIRGRVVHTGDCMAQCIPNMFYGVAVWLSCRLLHLGDVSLLQEIIDCPSTVRCGIIALVAVVIPEMLLGK